MCTNSTYLNQPEKTLNKCLNINVPSLYDRTWSCHVGRVLFKNDINNNRWFSWLTCQYYYYFNLRPSDALFTYTSITHDSRYSTGTGDNRTGPQYTNRYTDIAKNQQLKQLFILWTRIFHSSRIKVIVSLRDRSSASYVLSCNRTLRE